MAGRKGSDSDSEEIDAGKDLLLVEMGRRCREARKRLNINAEKISEEIGCSVGWIYGVESGRLNFQIAIFRRLLAALQLEFHAVVARDSEVLDKVPNARLNATAGDAMAQLRTASQALSKARDLVETLQALTDQNSRTKDSP